MHEPLNQTRDFWAGPADWPGVFWHGADAHPKSIGGYGPFFYAQGGVCSGRVPDHGYWCSQNNPRGILGQHLIDPPGGFEFGEVLPQAAKYAKPKGAVFHARGGSMPYFAYHCLVDRVADGKVHFDPAVHSQNLGSQLGAQRGRVDAQPRCERARRATSLAFFAGGMRSRRTDARAAGESVGLVDRKCQGGM
jgi:hypothetical protein